VTKLNSGIYQIRNLVNGKRYIGSTCNFIKRKYAHFKNLEEGVSENNYLQRSYNKYGKENFVFEILCYCEKDRFYLITIENNYILFYKTNTEEFGYNLRISAESNLGMKMSEESREKRRGKIYPVEYRRKQSASGRGKKHIFKNGTNPSKKEKIIIHPPERKEKDRKMSETKTGKKLNLTNERKEFLKEYIIGSKNINAKLTESDVIEIKKLFLTDMTNVEISKIYNVHPTTIDRIRNGDTWIHVVI
jgi:group I intron endonuclease